MVVPPKTPQNDHFQRKTHGCWVPPFQETPIWLHKGLERYIVTLKDIRLSLKHVLINLRNDHHFSLGGISVAFHVYGEVVSLSGVTPSCTRRQLTVPMISIPPITYPNLIQMYLCFLLLLLLLFLFLCFHLLPLPPRETRRVQRGRKVFELG